MKSLSRIRPYEKGIAFALTSGIIALIVLGNFILPPVIFLLALLLSLPYGYKKNEIIKGITRKENDLSFEERYFILRLEGKNAEEAVKEADIEGSRDCQSLRNENAPFNNDFDEIFHRSLDMETFTDSSLLDGIEEEKTRLKKEQDSFQKKETDLLLSLLFPLVFLLIKILFPTDLIDYNDLLFSVLFSLIEVLPVLFLTSDLLLKEKGEKKDERN